MGEFKPALRRVARFAFALAAVATLLRVVRARWSGPAAEQPRPWPDWYRHFVVDRFNPFVSRFGMVGGQRSPWASVEYVGRKSGTMRRTPVGAYVKGDHVVVPLPYGRAVNWAQNVLASGHCRLQIHGFVYELDEPQVRPSAEITELPGWRKRMFHSTMEYLRLRVFRVEPGTLDSVGPVEVAGARQPATASAPIAGETAHA